jgi:hypothetical protein
MQQDRIGHHPAYLLVDCTGADERVLSETYRAFAVECVARQVKRALVNAVDSDPDCHHGLRDALTMMVLAGIAPGFRLALVTNVPPLQKLFADLARDLGALHISATLFTHERAAVEWLSPAAAALTLTSGP